MFENLLSWAKGKMDSRVMPIYLLGVYFLYLGSYYYYLCANAKRLSNLFVKASQMDVFHNLLRTSSSEIIPFIHVKNYLYTALAYFFDNSLVVYLATSFLLYLICCVLIFILANSYTSNKYYGLLAVIIFSFYSDIMLHVFAVNVHVSETFHVLIILYFWHKSNCFTRIRYSLLYVIFTVISLFARFSIFGYFITFLIFTSYASIKKKHFAFLFYNSFLLIFISQVILTSSRRQSLIDKLYNVKLFLEFDYFGKMTFLTDLFMQYIYGMYTEIPTFYFYLITVCVFLRIFYPYKKKTDLFEAVNACIMVFIGFYFLVFIPSGYEIASTLKYDIACYDSIPVWALLSVGFINYFSSYTFLLNRIHKHLLKLIVVFIVFKALVLDSMIMMPYYVNMKTTSHLDRATSYYTKFRHLLNYFEHNTKGKEPKEYLFLFKAYWVDLDAQKETTLDAVLADEFFEFFYDIANMEGFDIYQFKDEAKISLMQQLGFELLKEDIALLLFKNTSFNFIKDQEFKYSSKFIMRVGPVRLDILVYRCNVCENKIK